MSCDACSTGPLEAPVCRCIEMYDCALIVSDADSKKCGDLDDREAQRQ